jgi:bifunctional enzyme CysN/CysC
MIDFRYPVQYVLRPNLDFRGFSGRIASGSIKVGEEIMALPSRKTSRIKEIVTFDGNLESASAGECVTLTLEDEIDISRGEMIVRKNNLPRVENKFEATICWMDDTRTLDSNIPYVVQHTTRLVQGYVRELRYMIDVNTLHRKDAATLALNEIGRVVIETAMPLFVDPYKNNRETGSFVLIDPSSNLTVAAGMIRYASSRTETDRDDLMFRGASLNIDAQNSIIPREDREKKNGHKAHVVWMTGLVRSGKTTIGEGVAKKLFAAGRQVVHLDGDTLRSGLCGDLGFSEKDRRENVRRIAQLARLLSDTGQVVICSLISPRQEMRDFARSLMPETGFSEIFIECPLDECKKRDKAGLYQKAEKGEIPNFTGISAAYDTPEKPDFTLHTGSTDINKCIESLTEFINKKIS